MDLTIGVDVGGTKIAAAVVDDSGRILDEVRVPTPASDREEVEAGICAAIEQLAARHPVQAVGLAVAGYVDAARSVLRFAPNLAMSERPLRDLIGARVGLHVVVENDANAAAWGEFRFGGGRGAKDVIMITLGTGLGGGIVLDGRLIRGAFGGAGEFGHVRMVPAGRHCGCGQNGCWEQYASGTALVRQARELAAARPKDAERLLELADGDASLLRGAMVTRAAAEGDPASRQLLAELGRWLGEGIADLADVLDPAAVVIGGGVSAAGDLLLEPARQAFLAALSAAEHRPHLQIVAAQLGNEAGVVGAADLARVP